MKKLWILFLLFITSNSQALSQREMSLANVQLNKSNMNVLKSYGNPNEISVKQLDSYIFLTDVSFGKTYSTPGNVQQVEWIFIRDTYKVKVLFSSNSIIDSIELSGYKSNFGTNKNVKLGSYYSFVIQSYGIPKKTIQHDKHIELIYNDNLKFQITKSNTVPLQFWIVNKITISSAE